jgi:integrase
MSGGGHIRRRGRNSFELKYDTQRTDGRRKTVFRSFKGSRREAQAELSRLLAQVADSKHVDPSKITVTQHVRARFAQWQATSVITPGTAQRYAQLIEVHIIPYLGSKLVQRLSAQDVEVWHTALMTSGRKGRNGRPDGQSGLSTRTIGHAHRVLSKSLRDGVKHGIVVRNVCTIEGAPKVDADEMRILTPQQVKDLPTLLHGHALYAPALVALHTGMRRGELLALRWRNVDLDARMIRVREAIEETKAGLRFKAPKSKAGVRDVSLPVIVVDVLHEHRTAQLERRLILGQGKLSDDALVFPRWDRALPQSPNVFAAIWSNVIKQHGINVSFHGLRHTHASQLIDAKVPITTIAKRLGHSSPAITLKVYAHLFREDDSEAAAAIDAVLGG